MKADVIIIGGGAAGIFCAIHAGRRGRRAVVIEHNAEIGRKIIISGGGRCNFTNINTVAENFISQNPHFSRSALAAFKPSDFIELVKKHNIEFYEKKLGQLFCRHSSRDIIEMLKRECRRSRVDIRTNCSVSSVEHDGSLFVVETSQGTLNASSLVVAAGGLSFPKVGATDIGYKIARQFGLKIVPTRPALVPLIAKPGTLSASLAGIAVNASVSADGAEFTDNILFTHRGLSGPAILQISNYIAGKSSIEVDLLPDENIAEIIVSNRSSRRTVSGFFAGRLPQKLIDHFIEERLRKLPMSQISRKDAESIFVALNELNVEITGTEGYSKAEVTAGGVSTDELSSKTMESRKMPGLYFIGEVVDVTGWLGGYNFQWAWSSGFAAGNAV